MTKPVTLNVVVNKVGQNPLDKIDLAGFSARGTFKRSDFGMKTYLGAIGDDVDLVIEIEAKKNLKALGLVPLPPPLATSARDPLRFGGRPQ